MMDPRIEAIVIGVFSGIITAALIYALVLLFNKVVLPWYRQLVYEGVDVSGQWTNTMEFGSHGGVQTITATLDQKARRVTGTLTTVKTVAGQNQALVVFNLSGEVRDRFFLASLTPIQRTRLATGSFLLEVVGDGFRMEGVMTWYDVGSAEITSATAEWTRVAGGSAPN